MTDPAEPDRTLDRTFVCNCGRTKVIIAAGSSVPGTLHYIKCTECGTYVKEDTAVGVGPDDVVHVAQD